MSTAPMALKPRSAVLDTCIWLNSQIGSSPGHAASRELIIAMRSSGIRLGVAAHSLSNVFYLLTRFFRRCDALGSVPERHSEASARESAWAVIDNIMEYAEVIGMDGSDARIAALYKPAHDDFEDDLVLAAAHRMGADLIVTDDLTFVKRSPLPALTAEDALRWITPQGSSPSA